MSFPKILVICSRNQWRSRTAETMYHNRQDIHVKSAGTATGARIRVSVSLLDWADRVLVMEEKHQDHLFTKFPVEAAKVPIEVLHIPDEYTYMDVELQEELREVIDGATD